MRKKPAPLVRVVATKISAPLLAKLEAAAAREGMTPSAMIRQCIEWRLFTVPEIVEEAEAKQGQIVEALEELRIKMRGRMKDAMLPIVEELAEIGLMVPESGALEAKGKVKAGR